MANQTNINETLQEVVKKAYYSATETLYWQLEGNEDESAFIGYDEDGYDEDGNSPYENCKVTLTITHKGETFTI